jgi:hypothetical protein
VEGKGGWGNWSLHRDSAVAVVDHKNNNQHVVGVRDRGSLLMSTSPESGGARCLRGIATNNTGGGGGQGDSDSTAVLRRGRCWPQQGWQWRWWQRTKKLQWLLMYVYKQHIILTPQVTQSSKIWAMEDWFTCVSVRLISYAYGQHTKNVLKRFVYISYVCNK